MVNLYNVDTCDDYLIITLFILHQMIYFFVTLNTLYVLMYIVRFVFGLTKGEKRVQFTRAGFAVVDMFLFLCVYLSGWRRLRVAVAARICY